MTPVDPATLMLAGILLLCAFALLSQRRPASMITLYQAEAWVLGAAALDQGFARNSADLYLTAVITLSIEAILIPMTLRRIVQRLNLIRAVETALPPGASMLIGVALIGVAVMAVPPSTVNAVTPSREGLAIALAVVLLGVFAMTVRRDALSQGIGLSSTGNGLLLATIGMPGLPFVAELSVALLVLSALFIAGGFVLQLREDFAPRNLREFETIESRRR